jgi:hypothetical protein
MNTTPLNTIMFVLLLIAVALGVVAWLIVQRQRALRLRRRFGPQYDLTVSEFHSRPRVETELLETEPLNIRNASPD